MTLSQSVWTDTDQYLERTVATDAAELDHIRKAQDDGGLPDIAVSATQGKFLYLLATIAKASRVLEIGTLGGYSTAWLAKAVGPEGAVVTLEYEPKHAAVAQASLERAGLAEQVEILVGSALDNLPSVQGPFDLVFIDADKANNPNYLGWALRLTTAGSVIVVDNVIRWISEDGPNAEGTRDALELLGSNPRLDATALQTVGVKGWDGLAIAVVR
ncbi:O-methyltransferase [Mycobacteroides chelonae]|uniref:O-methyltransferase n=1 Tax=Mycobacteroides chelonae TaxID=1774 RepID=UPI0008A8DD97|nr:O-methyltransferase [Mycobacteroides chelonae]OHU63241.1 methyltransferase [Mycobacteroides chelonae]